MLALRLCLPHHEPASVHLLPVPGKPSSSSHQRFVCPCTKKRRPRTNHPKPPPSQPSIIQALGYAAADAQLLTIPPYAFAFATTLTVAALSERLNKRAPFVAGSAAFGAIGYIILLSNTDPTARPGVSYVGTFFAAGGIYPATALALSWPAINVSGQTKRAVANAMQISIGNCGAVLGTQLYRANDGPRYLLGHGFALGYLLANVVVSTALWWILKRENERREGIAAEVKEVGELDDWDGDDDPRWRFQY